MRLARSPGGGQREVAPVVLLSSTPLRNDCRELIDEAPADGKITTEISSSSIEALIESYRCGKCAADLANALIRESEKMSLYTE